MTVFKMMVTAALATVCARQAYRCLTRMIAKSIFQAYMDALESGAEISVTLKKY